MSRYPATAKHFVEEQVQQFESSGPVGLVLELSVADVQVNANERTGTVVDVRPADPGRRADVLAAEQTRVEQSGSQIVVTTRQSRRAFPPWDAGGAVRVLVDLPAGSELTGRLAAGSVRATGRLGQFRLLNAAGDVEIEQAGSIRLRTGAGAITVGRAAGEIDLATGAGAISARDLDGAIIVKNSNGATTIERAGGQLRLRSANGSVTLGRVDGSVVAKTANGNVRVGCLLGGTLVLETGRGQLDVGIRDGLAAWLDLQTHFGQVSSELTDADRPAPGEPTVEVRARTGMGDIRVRRSPDSPAETEFDAEAEKLSAPGDRLPS